MGCLRFTDLQTRPAEALDLTSLTFDEFQQLVPRGSSDMGDLRHQWRVSILVMLIVCASATGEAAFYELVPGADGGFDRKSAETFLNEDDLSQPMTFRFLGQTIFAQGTIVPGTTD
jgi:hypothetical protein